MIKLIDILESDKSDKKKYVAVFDTDGVKKTTHFGAKGYPDYTTHKDKDRRNLYIKRHKKDLETNDPTRPGYLSMYILWNKPSLKGSIIDYKKRLKSNDWSLPI
jgi:hypothetical protein